MKPGVYLAGPIAGLTYDEGQDWREQARLALQPDVEAFSPLRGKSQRLTRVGVINSTYEDNPLTSQAGIVARDRFDCMKRSVVLMNVLGATKVSIGTMIEAGWADAARVPIVLVMEDEGNPHEHAMLRQLAGFRVNTLEKGIQVCRALLLSVPTGEEVLL